MSDYYLIFDATAQGYTTWRAAILPACIAVVGAVLSMSAPFLVSPDDRKGMRFYRALTRTVGSLGLVACVAMLAYTRRSYNALSDSLRDRTFRVVEGEVMDFVPQGPDGHPIEKFRIGNVWFSYSESDISSAFHQTAAQGGPIRSRLRVRIADVDGAIARLEIRP